MRYDFAALRQSMVENQLVYRGISDPATLHAMETVPREEFVSPRLREMAYDDQPLPIGGEQTISQPYIVALMTELAQLKRSDRVLEIGTGSGYQAAVLSLIVGEVYTIERLESLGLEAQERLHALNYRNVTVRVGDGSLGWPEAAPFDAILVTAGSPALPTALSDQLAVHGRIVAPVGSAELQTLCRFTKDEAGNLHEEERELVRFVPLIGAQGW